MKLVEDAAVKQPSVRFNGVNNGNGQANGHANGQSNGHSNGLNGHTIVEDSESESEAEEVEPVSASLVLRVVSDTPSPSVSRKPSFRRDGAPAFLTEEPNSGTFLQVQVQRSSSSSSLGRRSAPSGVNTVDFMQRVNNQTKAIQQGIKTLRGEVDNPMHLLDVGQEAIVLSGLNKHASESLKNIKNLYDETKYLKTYLEKLEAKVHYDIAMRRKTAVRPPWWRRILFLGLIITAGGVVWKQQSPSSFSKFLTSVTAASSLAAAAALQVKDFLLIISILIQILFGSQQLFFFTAEDRAQRVVLQ